MENKSRDNFLVFSLKPTQITILSTSIVSLTTSNIYKIKKQKI